MRVVFAYEREHANIVRKAMRSDDYIVACGLGVEYALEELGVSFQSARSLRRASMADRIDRAREIALSLVGTQSFFKYRDVHLGKIFATPFHFYLASFLLSLDAVAPALESNADSVVVCAPTNIARHGGILSTQSAHAYVDAVELVCTARGIPWSIIGPQPQSSSRAFDIERKVFGWGLRLLNAVVSLVVPAKEIRILASDNWKNIGPFLDEFTEAEVTLIDRTEVFNSGIIPVFRNRMRFVALDDFESSAGNAIATRVSKQFEAEWKKLRPEATASEFMGYDLLPQLKKVLDHIFILGGEKAVSDIERMYGMLARVRPQVIMVRASIYSAQTHFALLCRVGELLGIPSIELQHGLLSFGSGSFFSYPGATHIAEYGKAVREEFEKNGYDKDHLFDVGSPRFDVYREMRRTSEAPTDVLCVAPNITAGFVTDSYDVQDYFSGVAQACRTLGLRVVIKLRKPHPQDVTTREIIRRTFAGVAYEISQDPLSELFLRVGAVVAPHSTVLLESMLAGLPTIYFTAGLPIYRLYGQVAEMAQAVREGAHASADDVATLTEALNRRAKPAQGFMEENYSFDGKSAEHLASAIKNLVKG